MNELDTSSARYYEIGKLEDLYAIDYLMEHTTVDPPLFTYVIVYTVGEGRYHSLFVAMPWSPVRITISKVFATEVDFPFIVTIYTGLLTALIVGN